MEEINVAVELLEFSKGFYKDKTLLRKIDETVDVLKGNAGKVHQEVIDILESIKNAYDDKKVKTDLGLVIKVMETVK
jgi:hypothetical protein